jgi:hypothetical protein
MNRWLKSQGTLEVKSDVVRIAVSLDFIMFYKSLIDKEFRMFSHTPAYGAHISLFLPRIHGKLSEEKSKFLRQFYKNKIITFEYDPDIRIGGQTKNFMNFYMMVKSLEIDNICNYLGNDQASRSHVTICNTKNGVQPYIFYK